jgi:hypothetical protein
MIDLEAIQRRLGIAVINGVNADVCRDTAALIAEVRRLNRIIYDMGLPPDEPPADIPNQWGGL